MNFILLAATQEKFLNLKELLLKLLGKDWRVPKAAL
tara:strand:+ start:13953 stop:14060 length:108 start_codon:yes stop_codon:yes gene_type:complete